MADEISKRVKQNFTLIYKSSERMRDSAASTTLCSKIRKFVGICGMYIYFHSFLKTKNFFPKTHYVQILAHFFFHFFSTLCCYYSEKFNHAFLSKWALRRPRKIHSRCSRIKIKCAFNYRLYYKKNFLRTKLTKSYIMKLQSLIKSLKILPNNHLPGIETLARKTKVCRSRINSHLQ